MFVDIHSHILFNVDDGSKDIETSLLMLKEEINQGVSHVILTPHVQSRVQKVDRKVHVERFLELKQRVLDEKLDIQLSLGAEVLFRSHLTPDYKELTLGSSNYILLEFSTREFQPVEDIVYDISRMGFIPIVAHIERYPYLKTSDYELIKNTGALIQVNSTSILGFDKAVKPKYVIKMIKEGYVDIIASDCHNLDVRKPNLMTCYRFLKKHVDENRLKALFETNPMKIIDAMS